MNRANMLSYVLRLDQNIVCAFRLYYVAKLKFLLAVCFAQNSALANT